MPYYQATKSRNFGFGLTVLPYLVTYPSGPLGLVGLLTGDILGFSGGVLGPAWVFTGDCSGGDWELGDTSSSVAAGQASLAGAGSETGDVFCFYGTPFLQRLQCTTVAVERVAWQRLLSGTLCQSEVARLAVNGEVGEIWHSDRDTALRRWRLSFKRVETCLVLNAFGIELFAGMQSDQSKSITCW